MRVSVCFFYQAEDGIRDTSVTGVQTCALPILHRLLARCQVNDAETRVSQSCGLVRVDAQVVWPSVPKLPGHAHEMIGIYALSVEVQDSCYATHGFISFWRVRSDGCLSSNELHGRHQRQRDYRWLHRPGLFFRGTC